MHEMRALLVLHQCSAARLRPALAAATSRRALPLKIMPLLQLWPRWQATTSHKDGSVSLSGSSVHDDQLRSRCESAHCQMTQQPPAGTLAHRSWSRSCRARAASAAAAGDLVAPLKALLVLLPPAPTALLLLTVVLVLLPAQEM
jgi:hypothetical protein